MNKMDFSFIDRMTRQNNSAEYNQSWMKYYTPRPSDVYICTYAKSGTHWAMQAAQQIAYYGNAEYEHIHDLVPWVENNFMHSIATLTDETVVAQAPTDLRIIKTHLLLRYLKFNPASTYITVIRDPKEIIVSYYYFVNQLWKARVGVSYPLETFVDRFVSPRFIEGAWAAHVAELWAVRNRPNVLVLTYNEMKTNPRRCYRDMADVMGVSLNETQLDAVVRRSDFHYMHAHRKKFDLLRKTKAEGTAMTMRSGKIGNSSEILSPVQQQAIDEWHSTELCKLGSDFPYRILSERASVPSSLKKSSDRNLSL